MRVLVVSQLYTPQKEGGAERMARMTAEGLRGLGHDVHVLACSDPDQGPASEIHADIPVHRIDYTNELPGIGPMTKGALAKLAWHMRNAVGGCDRDALRTVLEDLRPDIIYAHNSRLLEPGLSRIAATLNIPVVQHLHDYGWLCPRNSMFRKDRTCATPCTDCKLLTARWRAAAGPRDVIAITDFVQKRHQGTALFPNARWHMLRNPVTAVQAAKKTTPITTFGFIGALAPDKGVEDLIEAFASLQTPDLHLVIAGSGGATFTEHLHEKTRTLGISGQVRFLGQVDMADFYAQVDCVVVPSRWHEPQSLVLGEAMSHGLPLIASRRGGMPEIMTAADAGLMFDPDINGDLAKALTDMTGQTAADFALTLKGVLPDPDSFIRQIANILTQTGTQT